MSLSPPRFKCRRCRHVLEVSVENKILEISGDSHHAWFVTEETTPLWLKKQIQMTQWTKGKITCPKCQGRLGSFNFVNTPACEYKCTEHHSLVHLLKSRVDLDKRLMLRSSTEECDIELESLYDLRSSVETGKVHVGMDTQEYTKDPEFLDGARSGEIKMVTFDLDNFSFLLSKDSLHLHGTTRPKSRNTPAVSMESMKSTEICDCPPLLPSVASSSWDGRRNDYTSKSEFNDLVRNLHLEEGKFVSKGDQEMGREWECPTSDTANQNSLLDLSVYECSHSSTKKIEKTLSQVSLNSLSYINNFSKESEFPEKLVFENFVDSENETWPILKMEGCGKDNCGNSFSMANMSVDPVCHIQPISNKSFHKSDLQQGCVDYEKDDSFHISWLFDEDVDSPDMLSLSNTGNDEPTGSYTMAETLPLNLSAVPELGALGFTADGVQVVNDDSEGRGDQLVRIECKQRKQYRQRREKKLKGKSNRIDFHALIEAASKPYQNAPEDHLDYPSEHTCAICLDLFCLPMMLSPCQHTFCEPCLRQLNKSVQWPSNTTCPMCRVPIQNCTRNQELLNLIQDLYPEEEYRRRRREKAFLNKKKYPLPNCAQQNKRIHPRASPDLWQPREFDSRFFPFFYFLCAFGSFQGILWFFLSESANELVLVAKRVSAIVFLTVGVVLLFFYQREVLNIQRHAHNVRMRNRRARRRNAH